MTILTITANPAVDISTEVDRIVPGHKLRCAEERRDAGGGGINVARVLKRFAEPCIAVFPAGGPIGALLQGLIAAEGVPHEIVPIAGNTREDVTIVERSTQNEYRFVMPGPALSSAEAELCMRVLESHLDGGDVVIASGSLPPGLPTGFYASLARRSATRNAKFVLDTSGAALSAALGSGIYLVKPSRRELCDLAGHDLPNETACLALCRRLVAEGAAELVALSMGGEGALLVGRDFAIAAKAPRVLPVSSVGAGDSFLAALVLSLARGKTASDSLRAAVAAGSAALLSPGTGLCQVADVERFTPQVEVRSL
jgi:6-phosphofructokinase 2